MRFGRTNEPREEELAALADGSLAGERRAVVEALVERSPELADRLEEQKRAVAAMQGAGATVEAPAALRARIAAQRRPRRAPADRRRFVWRGGLAVAAAAAVALALLLALPESVPGGPTVAEAAVLASLPATAPPPQPSGPALLARAVDGVPFPNWTKKFGWSATGTRVDRLEGRSLTTVLYAKHGRRIGYTIVAGRPLEAPARAGRVVREGTALQLLVVDGRHVVTWERRGRTCILSGAGVDVATLTKLAAWKGRGRIPF